MRVRLVAAATAFLAIPATGVAHAQADPLPSWNDGPAKARIVGFVQAVTDKGGKDYVAPADRIAAFDKNGTLWSEQPAYLQLLFAIDRVKALAPKHPEWKTKQPFKAVLEGDMKALAAFGNSDGDFEMLEWTTSAPGARLGVIVRHDDAERESAYDRNSHVGRLARGLDEGPARG